MADLRCTIAGITSPNPFWLASAPPTDKAYNVNRAFEAGWGGVVWKTLGLDPHVVNVSSRYGAVQWNGQRMAGLNNIELITDRPLDVNLNEIAQVKRDWPDRAMIVSLMVPCNERDWKWILPLVEDTGADAVELNFGCPHGMSERGMGAAVGQVPEYVEMVTRWVKEGTEAAVPRQADAEHQRHSRSVRARPTRAAPTRVSLINTINSIIAVDLDAMAPLPTVDGKGTHGGYCGPAVKPIALNMVAEIARDVETPNLPISGIGGIAHTGATRPSSWCSAPAACRSARRRCTTASASSTTSTDGLSNWMDEKGYATLDDIRGRAVPNVTDWKYLNLKYDIKARIDQDKCIQCGLCHIACEDTAHQAIMNEKDGVAAFRSDRLRMRRLQPVHARVPGRAVHHDGARGQRRVRELDHASEQPGARGRTEGAAADAAETAEHAHAHAAKAA